MKSDSFTAVVTSHDNERGLRAILGNLMYQTRPPDETLVFFSEEGTKYDLLRLVEDFPDVSFTMQPNLNDWGHDKRSKGIDYARSDWMGFFNDDDSYNPTYIEKMMRHASGSVDAVYCWWSRFPDGCVFQCGSSTSGNYIVRTSLAKQIGYEWRDYEADGWFINEVAAQARDLMLVPEILYTWNDPSNQRGE